jgi:D-alanine-D-alanine ligase
MNKINVIVLMGGKSPEHEVSVLSGTNVVTSLSSRKYKILPVVVSKTGTKWRLTTKDSLQKLVNPLKSKGTNREIILSEEKLIPGVGAITGSQASIIFIAMHGPYGEDGTIQGMLELTGIPYTGSGVLASAIGMDKEIFRKLMKEAGLPIPKYIVVTKADRDILKLVKKIGNFPYFVKPNDQGSSVGAAIARNRTQLLSDVREAFKFSDKVLVDEYIEGTELTCGVLGNSRLIALPSVEIVPKGEFFDYESKYYESGSEEIIPARISKKNEDAVRNLSLKVFSAIGAKGFARVDFILKKNKLYILEINTIPGLTKVSLLPKEAKAAGINYPRLLDMIIKYAIEK